MIGDFEYGQFIFSGGNTMEFIRSDVLERERAEWQAKYNKAQEDAAYWRSQYEGLQNDLTVYKQENEALHAALKTSAQTVNLTFSTQRDDTRIRQMIRDEINLVFSRYGHSTHRT
jgi:hypothetical protein